MRFVSRCAASCQLSYSLPEADDDAMKSEPRTIITEPPITSAYTGAVRPCNSWKTSTAQSNPQSWFVFDIRNASADPYILGRIVLEQIAHYPHKAAEHGP